WVDPSGQLIPLAYCQPGPVCSQSDWPPHDRLSPFVFAVLVPELSFLAFPVQQPAWCHPSFWRCHLRSLLSDRRETQYKRPCSLESARTESEKSFPDNHAASHLRHFDFRLYREFFCYRSSHPRRLRRPLLVTTRNSVPTNALPSENPLRQQPQTEGKPATGGSPAALEPLF